jgi:hypothetical protein
MISFAAIALGFRCRGRSTSSRSVPDTVSREQQGKG